jgi:hypothetical protein
MDLPARHGFSVRSLEHLAFEVVMKRTAALILCVLSLAWSFPAHAQRENRSIGENGREARRAAKQQRKTVGRNAKKQRKAMKRYQKQQRRAARQQERRHK